MKIIKFICTLILCVFFTGAYALETESEKNAATKQELKRDINKTGHRIEEAVCMESDVECLKQKVKNRATETSDAVKDKASEIKNKADD